MRSRPSQTGQPAPGRGRAEQRDAWPAPRSVRDRRMDRAVWAASTRLRDSRRRVPRRLPACARSRSIPGESMWLTLRCRVGRRGARVSSVSSALSDPGARLAAAVEQIGQLPVLDGLCSGYWRLSGRRFLDQRADRGARERRRVRREPAAFRQLGVRLTTCARPHDPPAVTWPGGAIGQLAIEAATYRFLEKAPGNGRASVGSMHIHSCAVGACALELANRSAAAAEVAHLGGLLHDIGKLVMPIAFGERALDEIAEVAAAGPGARRALSASAWGAITRWRERCWRAHHASMRRSWLRSRPPRSRRRADQGDRVRAARQRGCRDDDGCRPRPTAGRAREEYLRLDAPSSTTSRCARSRARTAPGHERPGALAQRIAELEEQAGSDELTGLANRRRWKQSAGNASSTTVAL